MKKFFWDLYCENLVGLLGLKIFTKVCVELGKGKHFDWLLLTGFHSQICSHWGSHSFIRYSLRVSILVLVPAENFSSWASALINRDFHIQLSVSPIWGQQFSLPSKFSAKKEKCIYFYFDLLRMRVVASKLLTFWFGNFKYFLFAFKPNQNKTQQTVNFFGSIFTPNVWFSTYFFILFILFCL